MNKEKTYRVLIEIPERWVDFNSPIGFLSNTIYEQVQRQLKNALVEQYLQKITLPEIKITPKEVKEKMIEILAERALEN